MKAISQKFETYCPWKYETLMLLLPQLSMLAGISGISEKIGPIFQAFLLSPWPAWDLPSPPAPREQPILVSLGEEYSADVNVLYHEPASQEDWVCKGF